MKYIRDTYGVPAKRGGYINYTDSTGRKWKCRIVSAYGEKLRAVTDAGTMSFFLHPTWNIEYL